MSFREAIKNGVFQAILQEKIEYTLSAVVGGKVLDSISSSEKEMNNVVDFLKQAHKGAKIHVEKNGKLIKTIK